jgi:hypothetical protein
VGLPSTTGTPLVSELALLTASGSVGRQLPGVLGNVGISYPMSGVPQFVVKREP